MRDSKRKPLGAVPPFIDHPVLLEDRYIGIIVCHLMHIYSCVRLHKQKFTNDFLQLSSW